jgi:serralysin
LTQQELPNDFNARNYLRLNPDLAALKVDPVLHYQMHGQAEQRPYKVQVPSDFNAEVYMQLNPDVDCQVKDADLHYSKHGAQEKRAYRRLNV